MGIPIIIQQPELPIPDFYHPEKVGSVWRVPYRERATQARSWAEEKGIRPAGEDQTRVALILIDVQNTFCLPDFELFVGGRSGNGAVEDNRRLCEFMYRNLATITQIVTTLDTHHAMQIFHPIFLVDAQGRHPEPLTLVSAQDVSDGRWKFNPLIAPSLGISGNDGQAHLEHYTQSLQASDKYDLTIWPYHAMLGGIGHALVSAVEEALFFHTTARYSQPVMKIKGQQSLTEHYSAIGPEVLHDVRGGSLAEKDTLLLDVVRRNDIVVIAGQAKSHCVAWTVTDLLRQIEAENPQLAERVYLLEDCSSAVVVPGIVDYTHAADEAYARFEAAGMRRIRSDQPLKSWPGLTG